MLNSSLHSSLLRSRDRFAPDILVKTTASFFTVRLLVYDLRKHMRSQGEKVIQYTQWKDIDFFRRFLDDKRLHIKPGTTEIMPKVSRSLYENRLRQYGYSAEDIGLFKEAWKDMLFNQS